MLMLHKFALHCCCVNKSEWQNKIGCRISLWEGIEESIVNSLVNILHFSVFGKSGSSTDPISGLFYFFYSQHFFSILNLNTTRLAVDRVKPWLTKMIYSSLSNTMIWIGNLDLGHLIDTLKYLASPSPNLLLDRVGLPHVLDHAVHLVNIFGWVSQGYHSEPLSPLALF